MQISSPPIYANWEFWAVVLSGVAIVLSQLPPVIYWFRPKKLEIDVHSRLLVTHKVGNPNLSLFLSLRNVGGRKLWVQAVHLDVWRDGTPLGAFPAQNYYETPVAQGTTLFTPFALAPDELWAHGTNFLRWFDRNAEKEFRAAESALKADIQARLRARSESDSRPVAADDTLVQPFFRMFQRFYVWEPGEYVMRVTVSVANREKPFSRSFRFALFESDASDLKSHLDDYKFGGGIAYNVDRHVGVAVPLSRHDA